MAAMFKSWASVWIQKHVLKWPRAICMPHTSLTFSTTSLLSFIQIVMGHSQCVCIVHHNINKHGLLWLKSGNHKHDPLPWCIRHCGTYQLSTHHTLFKHIHLFKFRQTPEHTMIVQQHIHVHDNEPSYCACVMVNQWNSLAVQCQEMAFNLNFILFNDLIAVRIANKHLNSIAHELDRHHEMLASSICKCWIIYPW